MVTGVTGKESGQSKGILLLAISCKRINIKKEIDKKMSNLLVLTQSIIIMSMSRKSTQRCGRFSEPMSVQVWHVPYCRMGL